MQAQETGVEAHAVKWHSLSSAAVLDELEAQDDGLSVEEADKRLEEVGPNELQKGSGDGVLKLLWRQINDPLIYVLLASGALAIALGKIVDGSVVLGVVVINTLIGFVQEYKAGKDIEALTDLVPDDTTVLRDGQRTSVEAPNVVPGDVVLLESGDKVPADARLLKVRNLQVDEAALTGESVPVYKASDPVSGEAPIAERYQHDLRRHAGDFRHGTGRHNRYGGQDGARTHLRDAERDHRGTDAADPPDLDGRKVDHGRHPYRSRAPLRRRPAPRLPAG